MRSWPLLLLLALLAAHGCVDFRPLASAGACRSVHCSGHGLCVLQEDGRARCICDSGYQLEAEVLCVAEADADTDADTDTDGDTDSDADTDMDTDRDCPGWPIAEITISPAYPQTIYAGDTVVFDGTGSYGGDPQPLTYQWYFLQAPEASRAHLDPESNPGADDTLSSESTATSPSLLPQISGAYKVCLKACNAEGKDCTFAQEEDICPDNVDACLLFNVHP